MLDRNASQPLYLQLVDVLIEKISTLDEGDQLSPERELCEIYGVSRSTVRQAINELKLKDYIKVNQGKGIFVARKEIMQKLDTYFSFTLEMKRCGKVPKTIVSNFEIISANKEISKKMNLKDNLLVYKFDRLRLADDIPMIIETSYVPYQLFPGIVKNDLDNESLYTIFEERFNIKVESALDSLIPIIVKKNDAIALGVDQNSPALKISRLTYDRDDNILEYTISKVRGDKYIYSILVHK